MIVSVVLFLIGFSVGLGLTIYVVGVAAIWMFDHILR